MKEHILEITVFTCGAVIMILELVGSRLLAPYLGTSLYTWTALIGSVLASLSFGYYYGGKLSRNNPQVSTLSKIIIGGAIAIAAIGPLKDILISIVLSVTSDLRLASLLASILLFTPASFLLAMVSPYATRLAIKSVESAGEIAGRLSAVGTMGSITGTFLAGFVLITLLGINHILTLLALILAILALVLYREKLTKQLLVLAAILIVTQLLSLTSSNVYLYEGDTPYSHVRIFDGKDTRYFQLNKELHSAVYLNSSDPVFPYSKAFLELAKLHSNPQTTLLIGGGGYTLPDDVLTLFPNATMDVVEIDPDVYELSKKYLGYKDNDRVGNFLEDGRTFLNRSDKKYDLIFMDAYTSFYSLPYQLTTQEAVNDLASQLNPNGLLLINIISGMQPNDSLLLQAEYTTLKNTFPYVTILPLKGPDGSVNNVTNLIIVASKEEVDLTSVVSQNSNLFVGSVPEYLTAQTVPALTDDYAPVDHYISGMILRLPL